MSNYSDDDDFEAESEEDVAPLEVNVSKNNQLLERQISEQPSSVGDEESLTDEMELHGRGNRMKLSNKPPEALLRQYQYQIALSLEAGKNDRAIEDLVRCTALARIVYGDCHWKYAESEADLAKGYWKHKSLAPQAQQHAEEARNIMLRVVQAGGAQEERGHIYRTLLSVYVTLGEAYNAQQKYTDAELCYQKAEKILVEQSKLQQKSLSGDEQELERELKSELKIAQGKLAANQNKAASSIAYFEEAIVLLQEEYGDDSIKLIPLYQMVGKVEQSREGVNHIKSIEAFLQAHSIANANYSEGTEELAETGHQLALAYTRAAVEDKDAETSAESYLNECIATYLSLYGPNHEKTLRCQDEIARLMIRTDRSDEAIQLLRSTLPAKRETFGEYSQSISSTYKLLGSVHMSQGNMEKALKSMNKCLEVQTFLYGAKSRKVKETQQTIDVLMSDPQLAAKVSQGKIKELSARPRFNTIVKGQQNLGGFKGCF